MATPYETWPGLQSHPLGREALKLREVYGKPCRLSPLVALSDPVRTPDVIEWANALPRHCAVIYRFNAYNDDVAKELRRITIENEQQFLMRSETMKSQSDGCHFKRHTPLDHIKQARIHSPNALLTLAAVKEGGYDLPLPLLDGLFVSAIFPSLSPSAGTPIGIDALKRSIKALDAPVFALGGINPDTAPQLQGTGIAGIAAVGALKRENIMSKPKLEIVKEEGGDTITFKATYAGSSDEAELALSQIAEGLYNAHHTGVPKSMGGKGVGSALVEAMSHDAHDLGYKIVPGCPFVAALFKRKPKWAEMAAADPELFQ